MSETGDFKFISGRCYYPKKVSWCWQVWFSHSDNSPDPANGAVEWIAVSTKFWRWRPAARIANEIWSAFNDGIFIQKLRQDQFEKNRKNVRAV